ncbi:centrosome-associated zinc finger protein Cp190 [Ostrinia nubilalis]|uniref:centrosome-associated zinc finger protein Cp190 n=1 Tax=Ostrinia nubilalis TaxID=29057 RepID=UPI00308254CC
MSDVKQVKVDNWGIYFLQRLKHFFNRTDYCDLTLQFQDNAQLKVHRLVLNACTEYFEILERTCEMYEDCLVMPDDLQADVVVPIVNFMYTGQLEFRMEALDKLYQTSLVMNMPVLSKLLEAHRGKGISFKSKHSKSSEITKQIHSPSFSSSSAKRSYTKAFESSKSVTKAMEVDKLQVNKLTPRKVVTNNDNSVVYREKKYHQPINKTAQRKDHRAPSPLPLDSSLYNKKLVLGDPRPTRYELPEELDTDNVFDNSFSNISYTSQPLMVHPETTKQYSAKKSNLFNEPTSSKRAYAGSTVDIVECKKISKNDNIFDDSVNQSISYDDVYSSAFLSVKDDPPKDTNQLFDQILDNNEGTKVTIESKDKLAGNLDHAKIISEVLKKYPHLVKSNKNIKLKILNTPTKTKKPRPIPNPPEEKDVKLKQEVCYTYETDVLDSKEAAKLIAMGAENIKGPWICLICGTPGRALNFTSYYNFRRHLVEVHQEKAVSTICEYCGLKSHKRNYLLHHIYTKHGVPPPPHYHFPKCNMCDYIALTEGFLVKHKLTHTDERKPIRCSLCFATFSSTNLLIWHIQKTGHKQDKKMNTQCNYCMKVFMRDSNYFAHIKTAHKEQALKDGIIEDSDDDNIDEKPSEIRTTIKYELPIETDFEDPEMRYQVQKRNEGKKAKISVSNQKILNPGFSTPVASQSQKVHDMSDDNNEYIQDDETPANPADSVMVLNENEYIMKDNQIIARKSTMKPNEYILSDYIETEPEQNIENLNTVNPTTSMQFTDLHPAEIIQQSKMVLKKSANISQPIQIVVSNEEEYKALMASNHSIIFDDGDPNKTLTVLTAAQNPTLNATTIDLDNNQSNDMMIIQDEYPLNVSEAVAADNSKYVVVYSHAMEHDDPNKQYQIITSQELGAQYVQSSAVMAQNFETITTTTPVVSTTVIDTQMDETWPQSSHQSVENQAHLQVASENELQNINETVSTNMTQVDIETGITDLPEVELNKMVGVSEQIQDSVEQPNSIHLETVPADIPEPISVIEENQLDNTAAMDIHPSEMTQIESVSDKVHTITEEAEMGNEHEITCPNDTYENVDIVQEQQNPLPMSTEEQSCEEIIEECNSVPETENTDSIEHTLNIVEDVPTSEENTVAEEMPVKSIIAPVEAKKQIQNLTSEWSEDEYDNVPNSVAETGTEESELEESIENINKEVQKQITDKKVVTTEEFIATETKEPEMVLETANVEATQEKISSLLNDWEDSQEEAIVNNDEKPTESVESDLIDTNGTDTKDTHTEQITSLESDAKDNSKKDDKIKSLVSDWDDEEEETKE